jgi:hypothetical protein
MHIDTDSTIDGIHLTPEDEQHARLAVCDRARDAADARALLEALGLIDPVDPIPKGNAERRRVVDRERREKRKAQHAE